MQNRHLSDLKFSAFDLPEPLARAIAETGFTHCTPIQARTLPLTLRGEDVCGQSQTGTGKTATFLIALFNRLLTREPTPGRRPNQPRAVVIAPTRELAIQIHRDACLLGRHTGLSIDVVYGGTGYREQRESLEAGVDMLIGTPGRLIDYNRQGVFDLRAVEGVVLDEADRMFDLGFIRDIRFLLRRMPPPEQRLNMLFSATLSLRVLELAYEHMNSPTEVRLAPEQVTAENIEQTIYYTSNEEKVPLLVALLRERTASRIMVFVNTKEAGHDLSRWLHANAIDAEGLSGDVPQQKRMSLLARFRDGDLPVLVATDLAARGLHIPDVSHVVNFDLPQDPEDYVHRIGRTARAGARGSAISFACETYAFSLPDIESFIGHKIPAAPVDRDLPELIRPPRKPRTGARGRPGARRQTDGRRDHPSSSERPGGRRPRRRASSNRKPTP